MSLVLTIKDEPDSSRLICMCFNEGHEHYESYCTGAGLYTSIQDRAIFKIDYIAFLYGMMNVKPLPDLGAKQNYAGSR